MGPQAARAFIVATLSADQLSDTTFPDVVARALRLSGLPADALVLGITPSTLMSGSPIAATTVKGIIEMGVDLAIDDFGTGYSSLTLMRSSPPRLLAFAETFMAGLGTGNADEEAIVATQTSLCKAVGMATLAKGVETPTQLERRAALGCDLFQGALLSPPITAREVDFSTRAQPSAPWKYPDPHRLWDWRLWNGHVWTANVAVGWRPHTDPCG